LKQSSKNSKIRRKLDGTDAPGKTTDIEPSGRRKWWFRLIALAFVPLLLLVGLEIVLRLAGYG